MQLKDVKAELNCCLQCSNYLKESSNGLANVLFNYYNYVFSKHHKSKDDLINTRYDCLQFQNLVSIDEDIGMKRLQKVSF